MSNDIIKTKGDWELSDVILNQWKNKQSYKLKLYSSNKQLQHNLCSIEFLTQTDFFVIGLFFPFQK